MSVRTKLVRLALVFGIVGQAFGISTPATASDQSSLQATTQARPAAISPLSSPLGSPDVITPTPVSDLPTEDVSVPTPSADDTSDDSASEEATPIVNAPDSPDAIQAVSVSPGSVQSLCWDIAQMQTPLGTNVSTMYASNVYTESLGVYSSGPAVQCTITADDENGPVSQFDPPITFTFSISNMVQWSALPTYLQPWIAFSDTLSGTWQTLTPTLVDRDRGLITVQLDAPATLAVGNEGVKETGWVLTYDDAKVDAFSGALSWQYDFPLPAGPGGVKPALALSYNSRRVDGLASTSPSGQEGFGWELDTPAIEWRGLSGKETLAEWDTSLMLKLNGVSVRVVPTWQPYEGWQYQTRCGNSYPYVTEEEQHWQVHWVCNQPGVSGADYWEVITQDGTRYRFGTTIASRWLVKEIHYAIGVTVNYTYTPLTRAQQCQVWAQAKPPGQGNCTGSSTSMQREVLLQEMTYPGVRVRFGWDTRWNGNGPSESIDWEQYQSWSIYALQGITLEQQVTGTVYIPVQHWQLTYGSVALGGSYPRAGRVLQRLQSIALSGTQPISLPAYTFGYGLYTNKNGECNWGCDSPSSWERQTYNYPRLTRIDNGYGAVMTADYATPDSGGYHIWNYHLTWRETNDGLGNVTHETYTYSYDRCYYSHTGATDIADCAGIEEWNWQHHASLPGGPLAGYHEVTQTITQTVAGVGTNLPVRQTRTYFTLWSDIPKSDRVNAPWSQIGRPMTETIRGADGTLYQQIRSTWGHTVTFHMEDWVASCANNLCHLYYRAGEVWLQQQTTTQGGRTVSTTFGYDSYGNLTRMLESGFTDVTGDERLTERGYAPNTDASTWIVNKPAWESVYEGSTADSAKLKGRTRYTYDGAASYTASPTKGLLTRVEQGSDALSVAQAIRYDAWGNAIVMTDTRGFTRTAAYEGWNHNLLLATTNALGQATTYEYYGVNAQGADGAGPVGMLKAVYDANGAATRYAYDAFGRLTGVVNPGDTFSLPTTQYLYADTTLTQTVYEAESAAYAHNLGSQSGNTWVSPAGSFDYPSTAGWLSYGPYLPPRKRRAWPNGPFPPGDPAERELQPRRGDNRRL